MVWDVSLSFQQMSSFSKLDFTHSRDKCFPFISTLPRVTTSVSQLSIRDPNNKNANTSSTRGTSREVVRLISHSKEFWCSTMLEPSWYLSLTIFWNTETLLTSFLFSNMTPIFFHGTFAFVSSTKLLYRFVSIKHLIYATHLDACVRSMYRWS